MSTMHLSCLPVLIIISFLPGDSWSIVEESTQPNSNFSLALYKSLQSSSGNIIVSPISLQTVLAMALQGAKGTTAEEMTQVLHVTDDNVKVLEGYKSFISELDDSVISIATSIFIEKSFFVFPDFETGINNHFLAKVERTNFSGSPEESRMEINHWVEEKTKSRIKDLFGEGSLNRNTKLLLLNAIHFKSDWKTRFNKKQTKVVPFHIKPNLVVNVKMMSLINKQFRYVWNADLDSQILEIPYVVDGFKMIIILPNDLNGLAEMEKKLISSNLTGILSSLRETRINVHLPKFKIRKTVEMSGILSEMGMPTAFSEGADFSKISNASISISKVVQKSFFVVNERGSEAAAASGLVIMPKTFPLQMYCNHPFIYMVLKGDVILFIGRLSKP